LPEFAFEYLLVAILAALDNGWRTAADLAGRTSGAKALGKD